MLRDVALTVMGITLFSFCNGTSAFAQGGAISGAVLDDRGSPVANALVTYETPGYMRGPGGQLVRDPASVHSSVRTGADGTFAISSLTPGKYTLCASGVNPAQLRQCEWVDPGTQVDLVQGQAVKGVVCRVLEGALLVFSVQDPMGRIRDLADTAGVNNRVPLTGANFGIGVFVGTRYARADLVSNSSGVRQYRVAVPKTSSVAVFFETSLKLIGAGGVALAAGTPNAPVAINGVPVVSYGVTVP